jgi:hypothetical protein
MAVSNTDLIPRVRRWLDERPFVDTGTAADSSTTSITVGDNADWAEGAIMEFQDNGEQCLVTSAAANPMTVVRGWNGTTAAAHSSIKVYRDPQYTYQNILDAIDTAIDKLFPYAYKVLTTTVTPAPTTTVWYDIAESDFIDLVAVEQVYGATNQKVGVFGDKGSGKAVVLKRNMPASIAPTDGIAVSFPYGFFDNTEDVTIKYRSWITGSGDVEDDGRLPVARAVVYGAASVLLLGKEIERLGEGEDVEVARSVRPGSRTQAGLNFERLWRAALQDLKRKHEKRFPPMRER